MDEEELTNNPATGTSISPITYNSWGTPEGGSPSNSGGGRGFFGSIGNAVGDFVGTMMGEAPGESLQGGKTSKWGNSSVTATKDYPNVPKTISLPPVTMTKTTGGFQPVEGAGFDSRTITTTSTHAINDHDSRMTQRQEGAAIDKGNKHYMKDDTKTTTSTFNVPSVLDQIRNNKFVSMPEWARNGTAFQTRQGHLFPFSHIHMPNTTSTVTTSPSGNQVLGTVRKAPTAKPSVSNPGAGYKLVSSQFPTAAQQRQHKGK